MDCGVGYIHVWIVEWDVFTCEMWSRMHSRVDYGVGYIHV